MNRALYRVVPPAGLALDRICRVSFLSEVTLERWLCGVSLGGASWLGFPQSISHDFGGPGWDWTLTRLEEPNPPH